MRIISHDVCCDGTREYRTADGRFVYEDLAGRLTYYHSDCTLEDLQNAITWYWFRRYAGTVLLGAALISIWAVLML